MNKQMCMYIYIYICIHTHTILLHYLIFYLIMLYYRSILLQGRWGGTEAWELSGRVYLYIHICIHIHTHMCIHVFVCTEIYIYIYRERERENKRTPSAPTPNFPTDMDFRGLDSSIILAVRGGILKSQTTHHTNSISYHLGIV